MSSTIERETTPPGGDESVLPRAAPDASWRMHPLAPVLGEEWAFDLRKLLLCAGFCVFFMYHNYLPLFHTDVWGHVAYGNWILDHRSLPAEDPFVALAAGVPIVDTAWLGQVTLAAAGRLGDAEWYGHLFAVTVLLAYLVLARTFYLQTRSAGIAVLCALLTFVFSSTRHAVIRPEMFGSLCFACLIWVVVKVDDRRARGQEEFKEPPSTSRLGWFCWAGVPLLFALWANLHGSFVVGLILLGCYAAGRALEVVWHTKSLSGVLDDRVFRRWILLAELAVAGTLLNPYGADLLIHTLMFASNPNLKDILEWFPLDMVSLEAFPMACSWVLMIVLFRHSRARVAASDVLLLAAFSIATCMRVRMISWYAPATMLVLAPHVADIVRRLAAANSLEPLREACQPLFERSFRYTLLSGLMVWIAFAFSPISRPVLGGKPRQSRQIYSQETPLGVTEYLRKHPPQGMVAAPQWWSDWLVWDGPKSLQVLVTTNAVHVVPAKVWHDYLAIARAVPGFERRLERYRVNTIVVCKTMQTQLQKAVEGMSGWEVVYEDKVGMVAVRKKSPNKTAQPPESDIETESAQSKEHAP